MQGGIAAEYVRRRRLMLWDITRRVGDSDAEDVLHDIWVERIEDPRATWMRLSVKSHCSRLVARRSRTRLGLQEWALVARNFTEVLEQRQLVELAGGVLAQNEVELLLHEWDKAPPAKFAARIRIARRKARKALE